MDEVVARSRVLSRNGTSARLPIAHMVCNQSPPVGTKPSLMTFREVINFTLFLLDKYNPFREFKRAIYIFFYR